MKTIRTIFFLIITLSGCSASEKYDVLIKNGKILDGSGLPSFKGDIGIKSDTIVEIGNLKNASGQTEINAEGLVIAPGFINMLSWANESLIEDGKSQSDIRQGVTLEVLGEGESMGPLNNRMKQEMKQAEGDIKYDIEWTTLGEYLEFLKKRGISTNIASFVGATTLRLYAIGYENRPPTDPELDTMKMLLRQAMEEGAVGLSSALQYMPASFSKTDELIELCKEISRYNGLYISHIRDEGDKILPSLDELIKTAKEASVRAEIYHLKQSGRSSWDKLDAVIAKIDSARNSGIQITADMYNYIASSTGFDIIMPDWVQEGGLNDWVKRLVNPAIRKKIAPDILNAITQKTGSANKILVIGFNNDSLKYLTGKTLAEIAEIKQKSPEETVMDLVVQDHSRIGVVYFSMSESNIRKQISLPWVSFCSDAGSYAPEGVFLKSSTHPRAYGNFARLLCKYVREEKIISLEEAVYKLTTLPANNLRIKKRGAIKTGYYADLAIFNPEKIRDLATFENPQVYSEGMVHVFVNGVQVLKDGEHTGAKPGKVVRGPGWRPKTKSTQSTLTIELDSLFTKEFSEDAPGGSILIKKGENTIFLGNYGLANLATKEKITENTVFNLGSISKTFVSNGILILYEKGLLSLEDSIYKYFNNFKNENIAKSVKIKHLLSHTSGLPDIRNVNDNFEFFLTAKDRENFEPITQADSLNFKPGEKFEYSNPAFNGLALIIEKVTGRPWQRFIEENIFKPCGMINSKITDGAYPQDGVAHAYDYTDGRYTENDYGEYPTFAAAGNGGIWSSVTELAKYEQAIQQHIFLSKKLTDESRSVLHFKNWADTLDPFIGYSWFIGEEQLFEGESDFNLNFIFHTGFQGGFRAFYITIPEKNILLIGLFNRPPESMTIIMKEVVTLLEKNNYI